MRLHTRLGYPLSKTQKLVCRTSCHEARSAKRLVRGTERQIGLGKLESNGSEPLATFPLLSLTSAEALATGSPSATHSLWAIAPQGRSLRSWSSQERLPSSIHSHLLPLTKLVRAACCLSCAGSVLARFHYVLFRQTGWSSLWVERPAKVAHPLLVQSTDWHSYRELHPMSHGGPLRFLVMKCWLLKTGLLTRDCIIALTLKDQLVAMGHPISSELMWACVFHRNHRP